jgi:hypothetical protein
MVSDSMSDRTFFCSPGVATIRRLQRRSLMEFKRLSASRTLTANSIPGAPTFGSTKRLLVHLGGTLGRGGAAASLTGFLFGADLFRGVSGLALIATDHLRDRSDRQGRPARAYV